MEKIKLVKMKEFYEAQAEFFSKHTIINVERKQLVNNGYAKHYIAEDGAEMWEQNMQISEPVEVEVYGIKCQAHVELLVTDLWSTDFIDMRLYQKA